MYGQPPQKPRIIYADLGYDSEAHRQRLPERGIKSLIAKRRTERRSGLGKFRWVVERTHAWLHNFRHPRIRFERRADNPRPYKGKTRMQFADTWKNMDALLRQLEAYGFSK